MGTGPDSCSSCPLCSTHRSENAPASTPAVGSVGDNLRAGLSALRLPLTLLRGCRAEGRAGGSVRKSWGLLVWHDRTVPGAWQPSCALSPSQLLGDEWLPHVHTHRCCQTTPSLGKAPFSLEKLLLPLWSSLSTAPSLRMLLFLSAG